MTRMTHKAGLGSAALLARPRCFGALCAGVHAGYAAGEIQVEAVPGARAARLSFKAVCAGAHSGMRNACPTLRRRHPQKAGRAYTP